MDRKRKEVETTSNGHSKHDNISEEDYLCEDKSNEQTKFSDNSYSKKCFDMSNSSNNSIIEREESFDFNDDRDGQLQFSYKPNHVFLIYRNLQVGLCTDMEVVFPDATFKCHRWVIESYIGIENIRLHLTTKDKFIIEYLCCLKAPELPMLLRAFYRGSDTQDFCILIGHEEFKCHYDVLRCYTDYFDKMERYETIKLPKTEVTVRAFFMIYRGWMLDQIPRLPVRGIMEVYKAAKYLRIGLLVKSLTNAFRKFDENNEQNGEKNLKYDPPKLLNKLFIEKFPGQ